MKTYRLNLGGYNYTTPVPLELVEVNYPWLVVRVEPRYQFVFERDLKDRLIEFTC